MTRPIIRRATPADAAAVIKLLREEWDDDDGHIERSLPLEFADMFSNATYRPTFFVAEVEGKIVGSSFWNWAWANYDTFEFGWMCVHGSYRRRGIGEALHRVRLDDIAPLQRPGHGQIVLLSTDLVERYKRFGFTVLSDDPNLMMLKIPAVL